MKPENPKFNRQILVSEWDSVLNGGISPDNIALQSNKKFYWKCPKGHPSYFTTPSHRMRGQGCPICSNHKIVKGINDFETQQPELMKDWDWKKNDAENIYPWTFSSCSSTKAWWLCRKCGNSWEATAVNRVKHNSGCPYCANLKIKPGFNDLMSLKPELSSEWDYEKNGNLSPDMVSPYSHKKVWWKCRTCHNSWQTAPDARINTDCPYCCNQKVIKGFNDFESQCPELAKDWDYEKNGNLLPSQLPKGSEKKIWWKGSQCGHSWRAVLNSRVRGNGCPYCSNKKVLIGFNDLFTNNPELKKEWDYQKNKALDPLRLTPGSNKKAWWKCSKCGNEWETPISIRSAGANCSICAREKSTVGRLETYAKRNPFWGAYQTLEDEWDFEKNANVDVKLLSASSNKTVWWKCSKGHSWKTSISARVNNHSGCPYCAGQKVIAGETDLLTILPHLAEEWDYEKNNGLLPSDVFPYTQKSVWWKCPVCNGSWKARIQNRANGRGCPICNPTGTSFPEQALFFYIKQLFSDAENRFRIRNFEFDIYIPSTKIAIEYDGAYFHATEKVRLREVKKNEFCKNNGIQLIRLREEPLEPLNDCRNISCVCTNWNYLAKTIEDILGILDDSNSIKVDIKEDYCRIIGSKRERTKANSFVSLFPNLLEEWDYEKNNPLNPESFTRGSSTKVWWICKEGHSWQSIISNRCKGHGCPKCYYLSRRKKQ